LEHVWVLDAVVANARGAHQVDVCARCGEPRVELSQSMTADRPPLESPEG
jgi:hypothetical protein